MPKGIRASGLRCVLRNEQGLYWRGTSEPTKQIDQAYEFLSQAEASHVATVIPGKWTVERHDL